MLHYQRRYAYVMGKRAWRKALKVGGRRSATILWARFVTFLGALLALLGALAEILGAPGVHENVTALLDPKYVPYYLILISTVTELARRRTHRSND